MNTKKDTKIINLFGPPCSGKTTIAAGLFFEMRLAGFSVELVQEFAKDCVYENPSLLKDQFYITSHQARRINRLIGKVDYVISDSPLLLGEIYKPKKTFLKKDFYLDLFNSYQNINFYLNRTFPYVQDGRVHTEVESTEVSKKLKQLLQNSSIQYLDLPSNQDTAGVIFRVIKKI